MRVELAAASSMRRTPARPDVRERAADIAVDGRIAPSQKRRSKSTGASATTRSWNAASRGVNAGGRLRSPCSPAGPPPTLGVRLPVDGSPADVPTMYHAIGNQSENSRDNRDLRACHEHERGHVDGRGRMSSHSTTTCPERGHRRPLQIAVALSRRDDARPGLQRWWLPISAHDLPVGDVPSAS